MEVDDLAAADTDIVASDGERGKWVDEERDCELEVERFEGLHFEEEEGESERKSEERETVNMRVRKKSGFIEICISLMTVYR